jgi:hypothetical protein
MLALRAAGGGSGAVPPLGVVGVGSDADYVSPNEILVGKKQVRRKRRAKSFLSVPGPDLEFKVAAIKDGERVVVTEAEHSKFLLLLDSALATRSISTTDLELRRKLQFQKPRYSTLGECTLLTPLSEDSYPVLEEVIKGITFYSGGTFTFEAVPPFESNPSFKLRVDQYIAGVDDEWALFRSILKMKFSLLEDIEGLAPVEATDFHVDAINFADLLHRGPVWFVKVPCSTKALAYVRHFKTALPLAGMTMEVEVRQDRAVTLARLAEERRIAALRKATRKEVAMKLRTDRRDSAGSSGPTPHSAEWGKSRGDRGELPSTSGGPRQEASLQGAVQAASAAASPSSVGYSSHPNRPNSGEKRSHSKTGGSRKSSLSEEDMERKRKEKKEERKRLTEEVDKALSAKLGFDPKKKPFGDK